MCLRETTGMRGILTGPRLRGSLTKGLAGGGNGYRSSLKRSYPALARSILSARGLASLSTRWYNSI
jgi:hypothetical protein